MLMKVNTDTPTPFTWLPFLGQLRPSLGSKVVDNAVDHNTFKYELVSSGSL